MICADSIYSLSKVERSLATHTTINRRKQGSGEMNQLNTPVPTACNKSSKIPYYSAPTAIIVVSREIFLLSKSANICIAEKNVLLFFFPRTTLYLAGHPLYLS